MFTIWGWGRVLVIGRVFFTRTIHFNFPIESPSPGDVLLRIPLRQLRDPGPPRPRRPRQQHRRQPGSRSGAAQAPTEGALHGQGGRQRSRGAEPSFHHGNAMGLCRWKVEDLVFRWLTCLTQKSIEKSQKKWWKGETRTREVGGWLGGCYVFVQYCKSKCLTVSFWLSC